MGIQLESRPQNHKKLTRRGFLTLTTEATALAVTASILNGCGNDQGQAANNYTEALGQHGIDEAQLQALTAELERELPEHLPLKIDVSEINKLLNWLSKEISNLEGQKTTESPIDLQKWGRLASTANRKTGQAHNGRTSTIATMTADMLEQNPNSTGRVICSTDPESTIYLNPKELGQPKNLWDEGNTTAVIFHETAHQEDQPCGQGAKIPKLPGGIEMQPESAAQLQELNSLCYTFFDPTISADEKKVIESAIKNALDDIAIKAKLFYALTVEGEKFSDRVTFVAKIDPKLIADDGKLNENALRTTFYYGALPFEYLYLCLAGKIAPVFDFDTKLKEAVKNLSGDFELHPVNFTYALKYLQQTPRPQ